MAQYTVELQSAIGFVYVAEASSEEDAIKMAKSILEQESEDETQVSYWLPSIVKNVKVVSAAIKGE